MSRMKRLALALAVCTLASPALAQNYPLQGKWGVDPSMEKGPVDCARLKTVDFQGERRKNSSGGVPELRTVTVNRSGDTSYRVTEEFSTGQIRARNSIELRQFDQDHAELAQRGGNLKLRRCK